jgi:hypothetical protein
MLIELNMFIIAGWNPMPPLSIAKLAMEGCGAPYSSRCRAPLVNIIVSLDWPPDVYLALTFESEKLGAAVQAASIAIHTILREFWFIRSSCWLWVLGALLLDRAVASHRTC